MTKIPKCCHCGLESKLTLGSKVNPFNFIIKDRWFWFCEPCDAYVGCHKFSKKTLGRPANSDLRRMRIKAHKLFDKSWKTRSGRRKAYSWLSRIMELSKDEAHIAMFDTEQCAKAIKTFEENL